LNLALGMESHCINRFKRAMCISCGRPQGGGGPAHVDRGIKNLIFCGCHKWMAPYQKHKMCSIKSVTCVSKQTFPRHIEEIVIAN